MPTPGSKIILVINSKSEKCPETSKVLQGFLIGSILNVLLSGAAFAARFSRTDAKHICDYIPNEAHFDDPKLGVKIVWLKGKKVVKSISINNPGSGRTVAQNSDKNTCRTWE
ncbi:MAG: hypothetical protein AB7F43_11130 [Bacteriovoracia bacterium]